MEPGNAGRIELLLQVIADELYVARFDRETETAKKHTEEEIDAQAEIKKRIDKMRQQITDIAK